MEKGGNIPSESPSQLAYLVTKDIYLDKIAPVVKEYKQFLRKNDKYFQFIGYGGARAISYLEAVEAIKEKKKLDSDALKKRMFRRKLLTRRINIWIN